MCWQRLKRERKWGQLYRAVGEYANFGLFDFDFDFDFESNDEVRAVFSGSPLFPYMELQVTPLAKPAEPATCVGRNRTAVLAGNMYYSLRGLPV
jgi:muconolactone delta-isomerase